MKREAREGIQTEADAMMGRDDSSEVGMSVCVLVATTNGQEGTKTKGVLKSLGPLKLPTGTDGARRLWRRAEEGPERRS